MYRGGRVAGQMEHVDRSKMSVKPANRADEVNVKTANRVDEVRYISGPEALAAGAEAACVQQKRRLRPTCHQDRKKEISWHNATFTV
jgi:hypothetical protein